MDKIILNVSMNKFILRLILLAHIFLTKKLSTEYLSFYSELAPRLVFVILIAIFAFYDIVSCALAGIVLIFNNLEYIERVKRDNLV
jgi:succinate dehydrogenase/fumarate reductase cytochrome b subunit